MLTWPLASTAIVVATVALALAWYERSRPSARVVALVATMAALAVVGRIAFAPLPNVKPTTDIVLLAGFAFGAIPGFAVGATAALVSNLFFGQGMHTPWQMLAWGGVGLLGAFARPLLGMRPGRVGLAVLCAFAGLAFGTLMDFSIWATLSGHHTLAEYAAIALRSAPFNGAHAVGNAVFALAFGPVLLAALARGRRRAEVTLLPLTRPPAAGALRGGALVAVLAVVVAVGLPAAVSPSSAHAATPTPLSYLLKHQLANGGFSDGQSAGALDSGWSAMALGAGGAPVAAQRRAAGFLEQSASGLSDPGDLERTILGLRAVGATPRDSRGRDLVGALLAGQRSDGSFTGLVNQTAFGVMALRAAGRGKHSATVTKAARFLLGKAGSDGGFSFSGRGSSSVDDTAGVVQALAAAGHRNHRVTRQAVRYLRGRQLADGGFAAGPQGSSNAQSTAWAIQAFVASGVKPTSVKRGGRSATAYLRSLIVSDGHVRYSRGSDQTPVWVTAQAQLALAGAPLPVRRVKPRAARSTAAAAAAPAAAAQVSSPVAAAKASSPAVAAKPARTPAMAAVGVADVSTTLADWAGSATIAPVISALVIVVTVLRLV